jgi:hypothetical protein
VFPVRYELDSYILFRRYSVFKWLTLCEQSSHFVRSEVFTAETIKIAFSRERSAKGAL